jgi:penicillin-binding protein 2
MAESGHIKDQERERHRFTSRAVALFLLALLGIFVLIGRMVQLQVLDYEKYSTRSEENRIQVQPLPPPRGLIFDRNGVLLADNRPVFTLELVAERVKDLDALLDDLRRIVAIADADIEAFRKRYARARRPFEPVPLKFVLTEEEIAAVAVNRFRLPGVVVEAQLVRHYPYADLVAHAVGSVRRVSEEDLKKLDPVAYSGTQFVGKLGVERFYERSLHGEVGYQQVEIDARGRIRKVLDVQPAVSGHHITVQLDVRLQQAAQAALGDRRGAIVAIEPATGGILALVSNPGYDPNGFVTGLSADDYRALTTARERPMFNRALNGQYAPGSTFKPIVGLAGLATGATTWERTIRDPGYFRIPGQKRQYRDWSWKRGNSGGQGIVDLHRAIYRSSNTYFYDLGYRMKIDDFVGFVAQFGYGRNTALDIVDASDGLLPNPQWKRGAKGEPWYPGDNVNIGIGQGDLLVTPLQLATAASIIANRGHFVRPRMLLSSDRPLLEDDPSVRESQIVGPTPSDWEKMVDAMEDVVHRTGAYGQSGTAWYYIGQDIPYRMAGKSGTAQVVGIQQGEEYDEDILDEYQRKHAWFIAFAPADAPRIALAVLVENGGGGSAVAAPVARAVVDAYLLPEGAPAAAPAQVAQQ